MLTSITHRQVASGNDFYVSTRESDFYSRLERRTTGKVGAYEDALAFLQFIKSLFQLLSQIIY